MLAAVDYRGFLGFRVERVEVRANASYAWQRNLSAKKQVLLPEGVWNL